MLYIITIVDETSVDWMVELWEGVSVDWVVEVWEVVSVDRIVELMVEFDETLPESWIVELVKKYIICFSYNSDPIDRMKSVSWNIFEYIIQTPSFELTEFIWKTLVKQFRFELHAAKQKKNACFCKEKIKYGRPLFGKTFFFIL